MSNEQMFWEVVEEGLETETGFYDYHEGGGLFEPMGWLHFETWEGVEQ